MHIERGVELAGLCSQLKKVLKIADLIFCESGAHMVVIAARWGRDHNRDAHERGAAIDVEWPYVDRLGVLLRLRNALGQNFVVQDAGGHICIQHSPIAEHLPEGRQKCDTA